MNKKIKKQMQKMMYAVRPYCDEIITEAMTCNHTGSMRSLLISKLMDVGEATMRTSNLPNPVFIAVGEKSIYAFDYVPRGIKIIMKSEFAHWSKKDINVNSEFPSGMVTFSIRTSSEKG